MATQKKAEKKVQVEFIKPWNRYVRKDVAAFDPETAKKLKDQKFAVEPGKAPKTESEDSVA